MEAMRNNQNEEMKLKMVMLWISRVNKEIIACKESNNKDKASSKESNHPKNRRSSVKLNKYQR